MKGLLYKDFQLLANSYKRSILTVLLLYAAIILLTRQLFVAYALVFLASVYVSTTISFDEQAHWDSYARTLPVSAGQIVQQHRNIAGAAKLRNFVRTCHHDAGRKFWSIGRRKRAAKHRFPAEICQQLVGAEAPAQTGRHDDTAHRKKFFHIVSLFLKRIYNSIISKSVLK